MSVKIDILKFIKSKEININIATVVEVIIPNIEFRPATVCSILKVLVDIISDEFLSIWIS